MAGAEFDYVVVGGGSAGSVIASRLSEDPSVSVCLLEAGGEGKGLLTRIPAAVIAVAPNGPKFGNWAFETVPQPGLNGRKGYQPRGKQLGGSSAINAMLYIRGHPSDYDDWANLGCDGWSWNDVLPYFKKAEGNQRGSDNLHNSHGPLQVGDQQRPRPIANAFIDAAEQMQIRRNEDFNGPEQEGVGLYQVTQFWEGSRKGERCSAAAAYLHAQMGRPNLSIITNAHAARVVLDGKRATGVVYIQKGREHTVSAKREIVLSGGAFNSPQILQLSGIGAADDLASHGIEIKHELPGVGLNLQDHINFTSINRSAQTNMFGIGWVATVDLIRAIWDWKREGSGHLTSPYAEGGAFVKSDPSLDRPDLQFHFVVGMVDNHARDLRLGYGYTCYVCVLRPHSRGTVTLKDANPLSAPKIDPQFLSDERDAELLLKGVKIMRGILDAPPLKKFRKKELYSNQDTSDAELMQHIRNRADTVYHPVGTCKMGTDDMAVVDPRLRVRGIDGLRVADASIMPTLIGGNTNAPCIMIGEKCADLMKSAA
ncbi:MAG: GMC family oxidoreductase [Rhizobiaceae bacterium]